MNSRNRSLPVWCLGFCAAIGLLALQAPFLDAGGTDEQQPFEGEVSLYLILDADANPTIVERLLLPSSLSLYAWNRFRTEKGEISFEAEGGYRMVSRRLMSREEWRGRDVAAYRVRVSGYSRPGAAPGRLIPVALRYEAADSGSGMIRQPAARAVLEAIRAAGRASGMARLKEIAWLGDGRFTAQVEVR